MPVYAPWDPTRAEAIIGPRLALEGPLLPILHALQGEFGHVPAASIPMVVARLNLTRAEVHGVVSFYHDFRAAPAGRHVLRVCQAEACQSMVAARQFADLLARLGLDAGGATTDGHLTVEPIYCLGNADEGDSGTFADRMVLEGDTFMLIEGMAIAAVATGAAKGFAYIRSEYPHGIAARRWPSPGRRICWDSASSAATWILTSKFASAPAPMSAARKRR